MTIVQPMPVEWELARALAEFYRHHGYLARSHLNIYMESLATGLQLQGPLQPDVDLILSPLKSFAPTHIEGHEVKLFKVRAGDLLDKSYYSGLDEALALLMFGFDYVYLEAVIWDRRPRRYLHHFEPMRELCGHLPIGFVLRGAYGRPANPRFTKPAMRIKAKLNPLLSSGRVQRNRLILNALFRCKV